MIYTVTFNPSLDYIVDVDGFEVGAINRIKNEIIFPGGKAINVSMVLKNLGVESTALGFMAGFTGKEIVRLLDSKGIKSDFITVREGNSRINFKVRSMDSNEATQETEINGPGPKITKENIDDLYRKLDTLKSGDMLVLAGSIPNALAQSMYMDIMDYLKGRGIEVVVDATKKLLMNVLPYGPFLIKPNQREIEEIFETELKTKDEIIKYARKLQEMGARNVLVSMASEGAVLLTETDEVFKANAPKGKLVNSVGAGDSMVAGFIAGFLESGSYEKALRMGICAGSASAFGDGLATRSDVLKLLEGMSG